MGRFEDGEAFRITGQEQNPIFKESVHNKYQLNPHFFYDIIDLYST